MLATELRRKVEDGTDGWGWEARDYLGMSAIGQCPLKLWRDLVHGRREPDWVGKRLCYEGYVHERDVIERLERAGVTVTGQGRELSALEGLHLGHIDGEVEGDLLEIKSCTRRGMEMVRDLGPKPQHRDQVQAYMHFGGYQRALVVYKERDRGDVWVCEVMRDDERGEALEEKARRILAAVESGDAPVCECGRCR